MFWYIFGYICVWYILICLLYFCYTCFIHFVDIFWHIFWYIFFACIQTCCTPSPTGLLAARRLSSSSPPPASPSSSWAPELLRCSARSCASSTPSARARPAARRCVHQKIDQQNIQTILKKDIENNKNISNIYQTYINYIKKYSKNLFQQNISKNTYQTNIYQALYQKIYQKVHIKQNISQNVYQ